MSSLNAEEAISFFKSYGFRVDEESVREWIKDNNKMANMPYKRRPIVENDLYRYNDWCKVKGTAYEEGIDDRTKVARLLTENSLLKKEIEKLKAEKQQLEESLGLNDWI
ncbi:hypothetical protein [Evansella tamaricis]|uniref:Uncharacterized protein n=1 Tax=Evansella tamaricis TaxID=2069301 RepID=A0ABS6JK03_9BACI|nr:hypothetical protein [Evansella tamaricis]MBU9713487.1 hypothetical protein [Evansella tamaricis]MBU9713506.1 hypothetical protein [Evansella tamaricis]MBU9713529.1 hypothetical protein [Evansella tamaricis]